MNKLKDWSEYPMRTCRTLHECGICGDSIRCGENYFDGGYGRRAHERCVEEKRKQSEPVFRHCNVCGRELKETPEFEMGMCLICAAE